MWGWNFGIPQGNQMNQPMNPFQGQQNKGPTSLINQVVPINNKPYRFEKELGNGAFGRVYAARPVDSNQQVAVKVVSLDPTNKTATHNLTESVLNEIKMSKRLAKKSSHIVRMHDFDFNPQTGHSFIVMELGQKDLEKTLSSRPRLNNNERKMIWRQLVKIANTLHQRGIVHLDIKPQNIIVFPGDQIKLADMGIAQKANTPRGAPTGTPFYSAPEVVHGPYFYGTKNTSKSDVWSWGAVLYRMAYGGPPPYQPPCYQPPAGVTPPRDPNLLNVLQHTLVLDPATRADVSFLTTHPFTRN